MSLLHDFRMRLRKWGIDVSRYNSNQSEDARLLALLNAHHIDTVLDVGANDGGFARQVLDAGFTGKVLSFEPQRAVHAALLKRMASYGNWAAAPCMALGPKNGMIELNISGNSASSSILPMLAAHSDSAPESRYVGKQEVTLSRLDEVPHAVLQQARNIHLKIDTQGYEMPVLIGAEGLMPRVQGLQLEMSLLPLYDGQVLFRELYDWVCEKGFDLMYVVPGFSDPVSGRMLQMDGIFFKQQHVNN